jgi:ribosome-associated protein
MAAQEDIIRLDQFLKWAGIVQTGGEAKVLIQFGEVEVNGETETRRGRKLVEGDRVSFQGQDFTVALTRSSELEGY